jgi:hypothetical protein
MSEEKNQPTTLISKKLREMIKKDMEIDDFDLIGQCRDSTSLVQKYVEMYYSRKRLLDSLKLDCDIMFADYYKKYRYGGQGVPFKADSGADAKIMVNNHDDYRALLREIKKVEELVDFLKDTIDNFKQRYWMIKNIISIRDMDKIAEGDHA